MSNHRLLIISGLAITLGSMASAWAGGSSEYDPDEGECVQATNNANFDVAAFTLKVDPDAASCAAQNQIGCRIEGGEGSCSSGDLFTVKSWVLSNGSVKWMVKGELNADAVFVVPKKPGKHYRRSHKTGGHHHGGGKKDDDLMACGYIYSDEARSGKKLGLKSDGEFATVDYIEVCSDGLNKQVTSPLPACPEDVQTALNDGSIPGDFAIVGQISDADTVTLCLKDDPNITVFECVNEETPATANSGLPSCSEGPDLNNDGHPDGAMPFIRNSTVQTQKVGDASCVFTCLPPPLTFGGRSQCSYICN